MTVNLKERLKKALKDRIKNESLSSHLEMIEQLLQAIIKSHPDIDIENLTVNLTSVAENFAEEQAARMIKFQDDMHAIIELAIDSAKQVSVAA